MPFADKGLRFPKDRAETPTTSRLGYARASTVGQTLEAQLEQLAAAGCASIYREKVGGAQTNRKELNRLLKAMCAADVLIVTRIDRLARSTFELFAIIKQVADADGQFLSLAEPWADTSTSTGRMMIALLGSRADVERDLIRTRTSEGRSRARDRGQHIGRPAKLSPHQIREFRDRRASGDNVSDLARSYGAGRSSIYKVLDR